MLWNPAGNGINGCRKPKLILLMLLIGGSVLLATMVVEAGPSLSASSAIVMDVTTGKVLFEKNAHWQRPMASTTKIMTALVVLETTSLSDAVEIDWNAARTEGSSLYVKPGEEYSVRDLLYGLMLRSGNDAAVALACHTAGSVPKFVELMNYKAQEIGMKKTRFSNPHGLPDSSHFSTAYDMAILTRYALKNPEFAALVSCKKTTIERPTQGTWPIANKNKMLWEYGADGVKTGYTRAAGRCLVSSATKDGRQLVAVVLNAPDMWRDSEKLLDFGFSGSSNVILVKKGVRYGTVKVERGLSAQVDLVTAFGLTATVSDSQAEDTEFEVILPESLKAPIRAMQPVGTLQIRERGNVIGVVPLVAENSIDMVKMWPFSIWQRKEQ